MGRFCFQVGNVYICSTEPLSHRRLLQFPAYLLTVPSRMNLPEALVTGRALVAVRGVLMACSIVPGRPDCVLGLTNPVIGRPDCVIGLEFRKWILDQASLTLLTMSSMERCEGNYWLADSTWQLLWDLHPDLFQGASVMFRVLEEKN